MKIDGVEVDLNEQEIELLMLVHPLFDGLSFNKAAQQLGWSWPSVKRVWDGMVKKYPMLAVTKEQWDNPYEVDRRAIDKAKRFSAMDDLAAKDSDDNRFFGESVRMMF